MQDLSQAMVKLSCVTDDTCCRVHITLQSVSNRLRIFNNITEIEAEKNSIAGLHKSAKAAFPFQIQLNDCLNKVIRQCTA